MAKKLFFILCILAFFITTSIGAEEWKVCLGSFRNKKNAEARVELLKKGGIPSSIVQHKTGDGRILYRVFYEENFQNQAAADLHKELLSNYPPIKALKINDIWFLKVKETEKTPPAPPVAQRSVAPISAQRSLTIKDSDTGEPVPEADVNIDEKWQMKSDSQGKVPIPAEVEDGVHTLQVSKDGQYIPTAGEFTLAAGEVVSAPQISLPKEVDYKRIKIVLDWGEEPSDLDAHLYGHNTHVYFNNQKARNMELDRDDTSSYGPETHTIKEPAPTDVYKYYVHNYTDSDIPTSTRLSNSEAQVKVYIDNELKKTFTITPNQEGTIWHVFDIVNGKEIIPQNKIVSSIN